jgi:hypothetical protein
MSAGAAGVAGNGADAAGISPSAFDVTKGYLSPRAETGRSVHRPFGASRFPIRTLASAGSVEVTQMKGRP